MKDIHAMCGRDDPLIRNDGASAPVSPVVTTVSNATLPRPRVRSRLYSADDARVLRRDAAVTTVLVMHGDRLHI